MEAKEKANELFRKMYFEITTTTKYDAIQCALIAVDELINQEDKYNNGSFYQSEYWRKVKKEIEKL